MLFPTYDTKTNVKPLLVLEDSLFIRGVNHASEYSVKHDVLAIATRATRLRMCFDLMLLSTVNPTKVKNYAFALAQVNQVAPWMFPAIAASDDFPADVVAETVSSVIKSRLPSVTHLVIPVSRAKYPIEQFGISVSQYLWRASPAFALLVADDIAQQCHLEPNFTDLVELEAAARS